MDGWVDERPLPPAPPPAGQPRSALAASPWMKGNFQGRRRESTRRAPAEPLAGEAGQGCGAAATCPRRGHSPAAFVLPAAAPRGGRAGPGVAAPPRPWLPRQCRRPAPRCRQCPRRAGRGYGRESLPGRLRSSAGHAGSGEGRKRRGLRGLGRQRVYAEYFRGNN
ncbi:transmembrane protein 263 isoform X2 [Zonotrichia albicollis]|uniref:transmembrane protein 263 isoform X2 n=1 Tax=Zonotrichia albicollis TaxID=44394 RepID=UPI003D80BCBB